MRLPTTIRWRLQVWYGLLIALLARVLIVATFHFEKERRFRNETVEFAVVDMAALLREELDQHRALALEQQLELIADPQPALCRGEHELLLQVATNLLSNAMDYNQPGGWVRASTVVREDFSVLIVSNSGPGIAAADRALVFERFYRGEKSRANGGHHSGLGLAIVEAIVKAHGGRVTVESELNAETIFTVLLPRADRAT